MTCLASLSLNSHDQAALSAEAEIPDFWAEDGSFRCQLQGSHPGRHVALLDHLAWDEDPPVVTWWLWWDGSGRTFTHAPSCPACHLPDGHPAGSGCSTHADQCTLIVEISEDDRAMLEDLEDAVHEAEARHRCQYTTGHEGPHVCLAQSQDRPDGSGTAWWVSWSLPDNNGLYTLTVMEECPVTADDLNDDGLCLHPAGHPGSHRF
ncbi:hypothetical protein [Streptomyces sp. Tu102]|uniref:hypothetical protein n=1 Tax=Streptomyces TaxID=1883 RepID=UPI001BDCF036|nr:hypothetical protein [Streptomyces sp. Tu102]MBT1098081.1 hypothetical protein [Streptomyces sp. Tu102]